MSAWLSRLSGGTAVAFVAAGALLSIGCGRYQEDPEYPQQYQYVAPPPPSAAELAQQQQAHEEAAAESREIMIGADGDTEEYADTDPSALTEFKPTLDSHGKWVTDATYGTVWVPASEEVGTDFQPYVSAGHWTYSDDTDYVWVSDYSWGWAPFHYGRWVNLGGYGWSWIPGRRYAGAWVSWRTGPAGYGYVGWAPLGPSWYWHDGLAVGWNYGFYHPYDYYVYCPHNYMYHASVGGYAVRGPAAREYYGRTHDYVPAAPNVSGGGAGGRVVANPSVTGPSNGSSATNAKTLSATRGPKPSELGTKNEMVVAPPRGNEGLGRAQMLATPRTAVAAGAVAPAHLRPSAEVSGASARGPATSNSFSTAGAGPSGRPAPTYRSSTDAVATAPRYNSGAGGSSSPSYSSSAPTAAASPRATSSFAPRASQPAYSAPRPSQPAYSAPRSTSSFAPRASAPVYRPSSPAVSSPSHASSSAHMSAAPHVSSSAPSRSTSTSTSSKSRRK